MSVPTSESSLVLAVVDFGSKYMWKMAQPGHSLSWPQSAHSGSRDPPPGTGWPPGRFWVAVVAGTLIEEASG